MKKKYQTILEQGEILMIVVLVALLIFLFINYSQTVAENSRLYYKQWHNIDLVFNIQNIAGLFNSAELYTENGTKVYLPFNRIVDTGEDNITRPLKDYYSPSLSNLDEIYSKSLKDLNKLFAGIVVDILFLAFLLGRRL